jgi:glycosyl transferase family 25
MEPLLVLEDDVRLAPNFRAAVAHVENLISQYGFVRLFEYKKRRSRLIRQLGDGFELVQNWNGPSGAVAYAISPAAAERLTRHANRWIEPVDGYIDRYWVHGVLPLAIRPNPLTHDAPKAERVQKSNSTLTMSITLRHKLRREVFRAANQLRRVAYNLVLAGRAL